MKGIAILLSLACVALPAFASQVRVDFDHGVHFSSYRTYSWASGGDPAQDVLFPNQLMRERISCSIEEALAAKGLKRVASGGDLLVSYGVAVKEVPQFTTFNDGPGWGWGWGWAGGFSTTTVQTIYEGTLVLSMVDARRKQLVFEGTSTDTISSRPEKNTRKLAKGVNEIFEKYPPQL
jgi:Domain of unknown function (DUF4136)